MGKRKRESSFSTFDEGIKTPAFGVYRPATSDWINLVAEPLETAQNSVEKFLTRRRLMGNFEPRQRFGTTFIGPKDQDTSYLAPVDFDDFLAEMTAFSKEQGIVRVPIAGLDWYGRHDTSLVARFKETGRAADRLGTEKRVIERAMRHMGIRNPHIARPDHVTLGVYDVGANGEHDLDMGDRKEIISRVRQELNAFEIGHVALAPLVVGRGYDVPIIASEWQRPEMGTVAPIASFEPAELVGA